MKIYKVQYQDYNGRSMQWFTNKRDAEIWVQRLRNEGKEDAFLADFYIGSGRAGLVTWLNTFFKGDM